MIFRRSERLHEKGDKLLSNLMNVACVSARFGASGNVYLIVFFAPQLHLYQVDSCLLEWCHWTHVKVIWSMGTVTSPSNVTSCSWIFIDIILKVKNIQASPDFNVSRFFGLIFNSASIQLSSTAFNNAIRRNGMLKRKLPSNKIRYLQLHHLMAPNITFHSTAPVWNFNKGQKIHSTAVLYVLQALRCASKCKNASSLSDSTDQS